MTAARAGPAGHRFGEQRERADEEGSEQHRNAHKGMKQKAHPDIDRQPRQIEERGQARARHERSHIVQVADRLLAFRGGAALQRRSHDELENAGRQPFVDPAPDAEQDASAQHVEQALKREQHQHEQRQSDQSWNAAARQHTVIDLQHEQRSGENEQADETACDRNADEGAAMGAEHGAQLVRPDAGV